MFRHVFCLIVFLSSAISVHADASVRPFKFERQGRTIAGEVHSIPGKPIKAAAIIIGGSSYRTRADAMEAIPLFLSPDLAVVLFDRRGNGASTGRFEVPTTENTAWQIPDFADDAVAVARFLRAQGFSRIGLIGTSMGGWINVAAAARSDAIDSIVCINGGASTVGVSDAYDAFIAKGQPIPVATESASKYRGPQGYDPHPDLEKLKQPAFWIFAELDESNPTILDAEVVRKFTVRGKNFRLLILPGTNHELLDVKTGTFNDSWVEPVRAFAQEN